MLIGAQQETGSGDQLDPRIEASEESGALFCRLTGNWTTRRVASIDKAMRSITEQEGLRSMVVDVSGMGKMDTAGAWLIQRLLITAREKGIEARLDGVSEVSQILLGAVADATDKQEERPRADDTNLLISFLEVVGKGTYEMRSDFLAAMNILGATIRGGQMKLGRGHGINLAAIFSQIDRMGVGAIPVVLLMSTIVGAIIAQQGAYQLSYFGADIFVVDLVGILVLRELGVLMTAIMIAGRSGSAITAEIGSMKMREEVDALTVIGLNPVGVLVFPRLVALVVALPCLTILANFAALGGGIVISWLYSDIPPIQFIDRLRLAVDTSTIFAGLIKAPFMALIIGIIGAVEGLKVGGSAESLGNRVTASVVKSIFVVIILDGAFAIFYAAIDF